MEKCCKIVLHVNFYALISVAMIYLSIFEKYQSPSYDLTLLILHKKKVQNGYLLTTEYKPSKLPS